MYSISNSPLRKREKFPGASGNPCVALKRCIFGGAITQKKKLNWGAAAPMSHVILSAGGKSPVFPLRESYFIL